MSRIVRLGLWTAIGVTIALLAIELRIAGLFRGLAAGYLSHPDEPKQIHALDHYLRGSYLWYVGNWFYDGYPYGLNHVDEWILRAVFPLKQALQHLALPEYAAPEQHSRLDLYYWGRALRVGYGLMVVLCTIGTASLLGVGRVGVWWTAAMVSLAPLATTVTHFATGDIGVDLFGGLSLLLLAAHARRPAMGWLCLSGAMVGAAFGCKYNGLLAAMPIACYVALRAWHERRLPRWFGAGALTAISAFAGVLASTPALFINWKQTWTDIFINFDRIRWFNAEAWRELPLITRLVQSISTNFSRVITALGWTLCLGALVGCAWLARQWWRTRRVPDEQTQGAVAAARLAICIYPLAALAISLAGKPMVQPFHFSYLVAPLILGCVCATAGARTPVARLAATCLLGGALLESGLRAKHEHFFWRRDDLLALKPFAETVMDTPGARDRMVVKTLRLEPLNMAVFRNEATAIRLQDGLWWQALEVAPLPSVPYPVDCDWIFMNGVVFPRNDRMFRVAGDTARTKQLVFEGAPRPFQIGLRTGSWPAQVTLTEGGKVRTYDLQPNAERLVSVEPGRAQEVVQAGLAGQTIQLLPLRVATAVGDVWVTVLETTREVDVYRAFGPQAKQTNPAELAGMLNTPEAGRLTQLQLVERDQRAPLVLAVPPPGEPVGWLLSPAAETPSSESGGRIRPTLDRADCSSMLRKLTAGSVALPAGAYVLDCDVTVADNSGAELALGLGDPCDLAGLKPGVERFKLGPGRQHVVYHFSKPFAPYQCFITLRCVSGYSLLTAWSLRADVPQLQADFQRWQAEGVAPQWAPPAPGSTLSAEQQTAPNVGFGRCILLEQAAFPATVTADDDFTLRWSSVLMKASVPRFGDYEVYVHLIDTNGLQRYASGFSLFEGMAKGAQGERISCGALTTNTPPGTYALSVGIRDRLTRKRLSSHAYGNAPAAVGRHTITLGQVEVR